MDNRNSGRKFGERRSFGDRRSSGRSFGNSSGRGFGGGRSGGRRFGNDRGGDRDEPREMHDIICKKCGKNSQVPFKPKNDKDVLCRDCFRAEDSSFSPRSGQRNSFQSSGMSPDQLKEINTKLDNILKLLEDKKGMEKTQKKESKIPEKNQINTQEVK